MKASHEVKIESVPDLHSCTINAGSEKFAAAEQESQKSLNSHRPMAQVWRHRDSAFPVKSLDNSKEAASDSGVRPRGFTAFMRSTFLWLVGCLSIKPLPLGTRAPSHSIALVRASMSGFLATAVDWVAVLIINELLGAHYMIGVVLGVISGALTNFAINKFWVFNAGKGKTGSQLSRYAIAWIGFLVLYHGMVVLLTEVLGLHYFGSVVISSLCVFIGWSYPVQRWFVFARPK